MFIKEKAPLYFSFVLLITAALFMNSCKTDTQIVSSDSGTTTTQTGKNLTISGQVISSLGGIPIDSATVILSGASTYLTATTDVQGKYSFTVSLNSNTNLTLFTSKSGYVVDTTTIYVTAGVDYSVSYIKLTTQSSSQGQVASGDPISIYLASQTSNNIGVKESGSPETAGLTFEVQDSSGVPIDLNHSVKVNFSIGSGPIGGEFLSPTSVYTNDKGQATVNITSGTKSGIVQIIAEIDLPNNKIISKPIAITIYGGLPDLNHFSIQPSLKNVSGVFFNNYQKFVTVYLGDKYGNPVRPNTSVYLTTTGGIIQAQALTNEAGIAYADLTVAKPNTPSDSTLGPGYAIITASTADENLQTIKQTRGLLFSGETQSIVVSPTTFDIPNGGSQGFDYTIEDANGNPISSANQITVDVQGKNVGSQGDISFQMPDTQNKVWTKFHFVVYDAVDTLIEANPVTITIKSMGANGNISTQINGICR